MRIDGRTIGLPESQPFTALTPGWGDQLAVTSAYPCLQKEDDQFLGGSYATNAIDACQPYWRPARLTIESWSIAYRDTFTNLSYVAGSLYPAPVIGPVRRVVSTGEEAIFQRDLAVCGEKIGGYNCRVEIEAGVQPSWLIRVSAQIAPFVIIPRSRAGIDVNKDYGLPIYRPQLGVSLNIDSGTFSNRDPQVGGSPGTGPAPTSDQTFVRIGGRGVIDLSDPNRAWEGDKFLYNFPMFEALDNSTSDYAFRVTSASIVVGFVSYPMPGIP